MKWNILLIIYKFNKQEHVGGRTTLKSKNHIVFARMHYNWFVKTWSCGCVPRDSWPLEGVVLFPVQFLNEL